MAKTLIDIDEALLERAAAVLGATTKKDTVNVALREVVDRAERAKGLQWLHTTHALDDLADPEVVRAARR
jgi:Arc/MetJ family transcription regulator